jgi:hypothetical protein
MFFRVLVVLLVGVTITGVVAGCGGGGGQGRETATGVVKASEMDRNLLRVKPDGEKPVVFKYNPEDIDVTLDGDDAKLENIKEGQSTTIDYIVKNDREVARSIEIEKKK